MSPRADEKMSSMESASDETGSRTRDVSMGGDSIRVAGIPRVAYQRGMKDVGGDTRCVYILPGHTQYVHETRGKGLALNGRPCSQSSLDQSSRIIMHMMEQSGYR